MRVKPVLRIHVAERLQVDADEVEARLADFGEVPPLESALARVGPIGIVAEHVDAAPERLVGRRGGSVAGSAAELALRQTRRARQEYKSCFVTRIPVPSS